MSRKPYRVFTNKSFRVKVKDVRKNDVIHFGAVHVQVRKNRKNKFGGRVLTCNTYRYPQPITLILPKDLKLNVNRTKTTFPKK